MGNVEVAKELIDNDVELKRKTKNGLVDDEQYKGKTPSEIADMRGFKKIVNLIRKKAYIKAGSIAINVISKVAGIGASVVGNSVR
ncbi:hypothetical protein PIROE2DRAFT_15841, partial [Piromyces sp. E2]